MEAALALPQLLEKLASRAPLTGIDVIGLRLLLDRADAGSDASLAEQLLADDPAAVAAEQTPPGPAERRAARPAEARPSRRATFSTGQFERSSECENASRASAG